MSTFVLTVNVSGAAFEGQALVPELRRCLSDVWHRLDLYPLVEEGVIRDANGNTCGVWGFEPAMEGGDDGPTDHAGGPASGPPE